METFINNKYKIIYDMLCDRARQRIVSGYTEKHHVLPKSLGGPNTKDNLVRLTGREHYIAHLCLVRCTTGKARQKMLYAAMRTIWGNRNRVERVCISSRVYEALRTEIALNSSLLNRGRIPTTHTREKYRQAKLGKRLPEHVRLRMQEAQKLRRANESGDVRKSIGNKLRGISRSPETRLKMSRAQTGNTKKHDWSIHHGVKRIR